MDNLTPTITSEEQNEEAPVVVVGDAGEDTRLKLPQGAVWNDDGSVTQTLISPVQMTVRSNGQDTQQNYETLRFNPLKGKQLLGMMGKSGDDRTVGLIGASLRLSPLVARLLIEQMDARDMVRSIAIVGVFTDSGQTTGQ